MVHGGSVWCEMVAGHGLAVGSCGHEIRRLIGIVRNKGRGVKGSVVGHVGVVLLSRVGGLLLDRGRDRGKEILWVHGSSLAWLRRLWRGVLAVEAGVYPDRSHIRPY